MSGEEETVKKTIEDPDSVYRDATYPEDRRNYFRMHGKRVLSAYGDYLKVVVRSDTWEIVTAYITPKHRETTELLYNNNE